MKKFAFALICIVVVMTAFLLHRLVSHRAAALSTKKSMQSSSLYHKIALDLTAFARNISDTSIYYGDLDNMEIPASIAKLNPVSGSLSPGRVSFEMHGGFDHFGYILQRDGIGDQEGAEVWMLSFYTERGKTHLCSVVVDSDESGVITYELKEAAPSEK